MTRRGPKKPGARSSPTRIAVLGLGNMGSAHARALAEGRIHHARLAAVADLNPERLERWKGVPAFPSLAGLLKARLADAILIATPHRDHLPSGQAALHAGLHVLVEKPLAVQKSDAVQLLSCRRRQGQVFAVMLNQRTDARYLAVRKLIQGGRLGRILRVQWTITDWFRTDAYYRSSDWRATWRGEGGGVLLNQTPHQLDLLCWLCGNPSTVRAFCGFGRHHRIEVEDDVTAYLEWPGGATGVFVASTGEAPGVNRLEISGTLGRVRVEGHSLEFARNHVASDEFCRTSPEFFAMPPTTMEKTVFSQSGAQHAGIMEDFVRAIRRGTALLAPAAEGLWSLELANAMLLSAVQQKTLRLPISAGAYARVLRRLVRESAA